jgi:hypothetical protein
MRKSRALTMGLVGAAAAAFMCLGAPALHADDDYPSQINVYVTGAAEGGFMEPDVADSVKDVRKALDKKKIFRIVDHEDRADLVVLILGRGYERTGKRIYSSHHGKHSYHSSSRDEKVMVVRGGLVAGHYKLGLIGVDSLFWSSAAKNLAAKVEKWAKGNYEQVVARRDRKNEGKFSAAGAEDFEEEGGGRDDDR